jgi:hypothetical protein
LYLPATISPVAPLAGDLLEECLVIGTERAGVAAQTRLSEVAAMRASDQKGAKT